MQVKHLQSRLALISPSTSRPRHMHEWCISLKTPRIFGVGRLRQPPQLCLLPPPSLHPSRTVIPVRPIPRKSVYQVLYMTLKHANRSVEDVGFMHMVDTYLREYEGYASFMVEAIERAT
jgi:hypothetical protein